MQSIKEHKEKKNITALRHKRGVQAGIAVAAGILAAILGGSYLALRNYVQKVEPDKICDNITIGITDVSGMTKTEALAALNSQEDTDSSRTVTLKLRDERIEVFLKEAGFDTPDAGELVNQALDYGKKGSMMTRYTQMKKLEEEPYVIQQDYTVKKKSLDEICKERAESLLQGPENAYITRGENGELNLVEEKEGEIIDLDTTIAGITDYLNADWDHGDFEAELAVKTEAPEIVKADLSDITDELGSFWTDAGGGERWTNLKTGVGKLNGTILMPGEELSVYEATAPYDEEHGYAEGTAYENGEIVPSWGGGICQVSTTLYNAVIYAELEVVERHPHSMTVDYVKPSRDAAIAGGSLDFRFKNSYDTPIYIFGEIDSDNRLRIAIYGKDTRPANRTVEFESETLSYEEYSVTYRTNYNLPFGDMEYAGSPHSGVDAQLWKIVYEDGVEVSREVFNTSYYAKSDEIIEVGTSGGSSWAISELESAVASQNVNAIYDAINAGYGYYDYEDDYDDYEEDYY